MRALAMRIVGQPQLDRSSIGILFVDLLFALAVGQVFAPIARWAESGTSLSAQQSSALAVALTLVMTSWIGYHSSANRARFLVKFINIELAKLVLDILMVALYFYVAAVAVRRHEGPSYVAQHQAAAVAAAFGLYLLWDLASAWQKRKGSSYKRVWVADSSVTEDWEPTHWSRVLVTLAMLVATTLYALALQSADKLTRAHQIRASVTLIAALVAYRVLKVLVSPVKTSDAGTTTTS
jgi:hypothetical protein